MRKLVLTLLLVLALPASARAAASVGAASWGDAGAAVERIIRRAVSPRDRTAVPA